MLFRQSFDADSSTYTYLLADEGTREAVIIDPVIEQFARDRTLLEELELTLLYALDTHVHADHVTGCGLLRERLGARTVVSERAGIVCADLQVKQGDRIRFGRHELEVRETPGHTSGCVTFVCSAEKMAFTGDAVLIRGCGRTDFQQGDAATLYRSVHEQILTLPEDTTLYPAHDYKGRNATSVREELRWNPRLGRARSLPEFVQIMAELKLPYPKKLDVALPANSQCGVLREVPAQAAAIDTSWGEIALSGVGVPEVTPEWLHEQPSGQLVLLDVREPDEYRGELGHIGAAALVPLATLRAAARGLSRDRPIVAICRSGGRSGRAAIDLAAIGFTRVASLRGGMLAWNARGLPIERGPAEHQVLSRQG
jgi:glyoxylase-like metal-dependent hydrolase (beta-lactamase superfamily II)/rhodanese-related sulfurtransferase